MFTIDDEMTAAVLVAAYYGCVEIVARDTGAAGEGVHDFELTRPDGEVVALEVSTAAKAAEISQWVAVNGQDWAMTKLQHSWGLSLVPTATVPIGKLRKKCEPLLAVLEAHGVERVEGVNHTFPLPAQEAIAALRALGVRHAKCFRDTGETVVVISSSGVYSTSPSSMNEAVEPVAESNAAKLGRADAVERHLFVWIDSTIHGAALSMHTDHTPDEVPDLPEGIDTLWAARGSTVPHKVVSRLWRVTPPGPWEVIVGRAG